MGGQDPNGSHPAGAAGRARVIVLPWFTTNPSQALAVPSLPCAPGSSSQEAAKQPATGSTLEPPDSPRETQATAF